MARMMRAILLASATAASFFGLSQKPRRGAAPFGLLDDRSGAEHEQPAQVLVALVTDLAEPVFTSGGALARGDADPGRKVPARAKGLRIGHPRFREGRLLSATLTPPIGPMPGIVARHWLVWSCRCHAISRASVAFNLMASPSSWLASTPTISRASTGTP